MNKKLIAIAVAAGMAAPMAANAAPTVYGQLQGEIVSYDRDTGDTGADTDLVDNGRGRIGMKGSHDLGGGLSSVYKAEFAVDTSENTSPAIDNRTTYIGLKGNFGQLTIGKQDTPYKSTNLDPFNTTVLEARSDRAQSNSHWTHHGFIDNAIEYNNKFGNVNVGILYGLYSDDDDTAGNEAEGGYSVAVDFPAGPVKVILAHSVDGSDDAATTEDNTFSKVAAQFKTGPWTFDAQYEMEEGDGGNSGSAGEIDYMYVAASFTMGKNMFYARVGQRDEDGTASDNDHMMVALQHKFSKTTRAWVGYANDDVDSNGYDTSQLSAGMRVDF